jgi:hypothetical protein
MKNHSVRWTVLIAMLSVCFVMALLLTPIVAQSQIGQETVAAAVDAYFTQTALAYEDFVASATARPDYNIAQTATTAFQSTVAAQFRDSIVETVSAQGTAIITTAQAAAVDLSITTLNVNNLNTLAEIYSFPMEAAVTDAEFSPSSRWLAVGNERGNISLWDMQTGDAARTLLGHDSAVTALMFSPTEHLLASASRQLDGVSAIPVPVRIWDYTTGQQLHELYGHTTSVVAMVFSSDGLRLVTLGASREALVWNTLTGDLLYRLEVNFARNLIAVAHAKHQNTVWIVDSRFEVHQFQLPDVEVLSIPFNNATIAANYTGLRWDAIEQREFYNRRGSLLYNVSFIRAVDTDTVRSMGGSRLLAIDEANTMLAIVRESNLYIFGVLTGARADAAATATTSALNILTATAAQATLDAESTAQAVATSSAATAQVVATSRAATLAVADLDDCPGTIIEGKGDVLRIGRMQPDLDSPVVGAIRAGSVIEITSQVENEDGSWYEISQNNRRFGFVEAEYVIIECE